MVQNWTTLQEYMRSKYELEEDQPQMMSMVWSYEDGRSQKIVIRKYKAFNAELIELKSPFARVGDVDALEMVKKNSELPLATVALSGDVFIVVYNMLMAQLSEHNFELAVSRVAAVADALEEKYAKRDEF